MLTTPEAWEASLLRINREILHPIRDSEMTGKDPLRISKIGEVDRRAFRDDIYGRLLLFNCYNPFFISHSHLNLWFDI